jgi:NTP pyrophosphatase (non-canonical NTP hydrolase)
MDLRQLQDEHHIWVNKNFPNQQPHQALLGVAEEVGEFAHAHLKMEQGIRGYDEAKGRAEVADAIGDIIIYLASYCNTNDYDLNECVEAAWTEVGQRDWTKDKVNG